MAELGNDTRLVLFQTLVRFGSDGMTIGQIQSYMQIPASTLAFHLRGLISVGLVEQRREGRNVICTARIDVLRRALAAIQKDCCKGPDPAVSCGSPMQIPEISIEVKLKE